MAGNAGNVTAAAVFLSILLVLIEPVVEYFGGLPPSTFLSTLGVTPGEYIIIALIVAIATIWSASQILVVIIDALADLFFWIYNNEKLRRSSNVIAARAVYLIRREIRHHRTQMKKSEAL